MGNGDPDDISAHALGREGLGLLLEVAALLSADLARDLPSRGLTQARVTLLGLLGERGPSTQRSLADALDVSPRNITGLVDALVATGFVTREAHPADGRAVLVTPTAHGTAELAGRASAYDTLAARIFGDMGPDRLVDLVDGLREVTDELRSALGDGAEDKTPGEGGRG